MKRFGITKSSGHQPKSRIRSWPGDKRRLPVGLRKQRRFRWLLRKLRIGDDAQASRSALAEIASTPNNAWFVERVLHLPLLGVLLRGSRFPQDSRFISGGISRNSATLGGVLQYTIATLFSNAARIQEFEDLRTQITSDSRAEEGAPNGDEESLVRFREFGFSLFLTSQQLKAAPSTDQQIAVVRRILDFRPSPITAFAVHKIYEFASRATTVRQIQKSIETSTYDQSIKGFLLALLHPTPRLTSERVIGALTYASHCSAIDQWLILIRCCQSLYVLGEAKELAAIPSLGRLLNEIRSVETERLATCIFGHHSHNNTHPSALEASLISQFYPEHPLPDKSNDVLKLLVLTIRAIGGFDRKEVVASLAVLDRTSAQLSDNRLGGVVCAIMSQLSGLTEARSVDASRWLEVTSHELFARLIANRSLFDAVYRGSKSGSEDELLQQAIFAAKEEMWENVVAYSDKLEASREVAALTIDALLHMRDLPRAIAQAANACVSFPSLLHRVPLVEILKGVPRARPKSINECLSCAIVLDLGVRHISTEYSRRRNFAVEDTLRVAKVSAPSMLLSISADPKTTHLLLHFLSTICIPSVMDTVPIGDSSKALLEERVRILQGLLERGYTARADLESEIVQLSAEITVAAERANLDQQRIYVDTEGLSSRLSESIRGEFELYRRFRLLDPRRVANADILRRVKEVLPNILLLDVEDVLSELASEAASYLLRIIKITRHEFALGEVHGLDGYLSGGIRHGNLEALLRQPFVSADILGTFDSKGKFILPKSFESFPSDDMTKSKICDALRSFSEAFQVIIVKVLNEWIQIRLEDKPKDALFDFSVTTEDVLRLQARISDTQNVDECVLACVDYWWGRVLANLERARYRVRRTLRDDLERIIDTLAKSLDAIENPILHVLVTNLVNPVRANLEIALETLASWFEVGHSLDAGEIELPLVMAVAQSTIKNLHPRVRFEWRLSPPDVEVMITRRSLKHWVDILLTLFHNVVQHSGQWEVVRVNVASAATGQHVSIEVSNPLGPDVKEGDLHQAILAVNQQLEASAYLSGVRREGRSGLMKVLKAARVDLRAEYSTLKISVVDRSFKVELRIPQSPFVRVMENNERPTC